MLSAHRAHGQCLGHAAQMLAQHFMKSSDTLERIQHRTREHVQTMS